MYRFITIVIPAIKQNFKNIARVWKVPGDFNRLISKPYLYKKI